jgi:hypothetical protein
MLGFSLNLHPCISLLHSILWTVDSKRNQGETQAVCKPCGRWYWTEYHRVPGYIVELELLELFVEVFLTEFVTFCVRLSG